MLRISAHSTFQFRTSVSATALARPETTKSFAMPTNDSSLLHDGKHLLPPGPHSGSDHPQPSVPVVHMRPSISQCALENTNLVA